MTARNRQDVHTNSVVSTILILFMKLPIFVIVATSGTNNCTEFNTVKLSLRDWIIGEFFFSILHIILVWVVVCKYDEKNNKRNLLIIYNTIWNIFFFISIIWLIIGNMILKENSSQCEGNTFYSVGYFLVLFYDVCLPFIMLKVLIDYYIDSKNDKSVMIPDLTPKVYVIDDKESEESKTV